MQWGSFILSAVAIGSAFGALKLLADAQQWAREEEAWGDQPWIHPEFEWEARDASEGDA